MYTVLVGLFLTVLVAPIIGNLLLPLELDWNSCTHPRTVQNFNPQKFAGTWYDVKRYNNAIFTGQCGTAIYTWNYTSEVLDMNYKNLNITKYFTLRPIDLANGQFKLYRDGIKTPLVYQILDTDYVNYSIVWTCTEVLHGIGNAQTLNIFSRTPTLDPAILATATNAIQSRNLDATDLHHVDQSISICVKS